MSSIPSDINQRSSQSPKSLGAPRHLVEIVIVTWNSASDIEECLEHVFKNTADWPYRVTVIDNASSDQTPILLRRWASSIRVLELDTNHGWIGAVNLALTTIDADLFFFLNPDARVQATWLSRLVTALLEEPTFGFATSKFLSPDGTIQSAGYRLNNWFRFHSIGFGEVDQGQYDFQRTVPFCGGMFLVRRTVVDEIGLLDSGFGLGYFEDHDFLLRARYRGYRIRYVAQSVIVHAGGASFRRLGDARRQILVQNWLRFMLLHWPWYWILARLPVEVLLPFRESLKGLSPLPTLRGWWSCLRNLRSSFVRRRELSHLRMSRKQCGLP